MPWISFPLFAVPDAPADAVPTGYAARRVSDDAAARLLADPAHGCHVSTPAEIGLAVVEAEAAATSQAVV